MTCDISTLVSQEIILKNKYPLSKIYAFLMIKPYAY